MKFDKSSQNFSFVALGRLAGSGSQAIFYFIFAFFLEPELYGEMSYLIALAGTFSIISRFGLNQTVTVYQAKNENSIVNQINVLSLLTTSVAAIILLPINIFAAFLALSLSFFPMNQYNFLGQKNYKKFMINSITRSILLIIIPVSLFFIWDISGILIGMTVSYFICSLDFLRKIKFQINSFNEIKNNFSVIIHNFGADLSTNLSRRIDKLLIAPLLGFTSLGIYQFNIQILFGLELIPIAIHSFLLSEESSGKKHKKIEYYVILMSIIISLIVFFIAPPVIENILPEYSEGIPSLQLLVLTLIPLSIMAILNAKLQALESKKIGYSALIRIGSLLILIATIGNWYGLMGLSVSVLLSVIFHVIFLAILYTSTNHKQNNSVNSSKL